MADIQVKHTQYQGNPNQRQSTMPYYTKMAITKTSKCGGWRDSLAVKSWLLPAPGNSQPSMEADALFWSTNAIEH